MLENIIIILGILCLLIAFFFVYKWYFLYAKIKKINLIDIFFKGYYRPKFMHPNNTSFDKKETAELNLYLNITFVLMGIAFVLVLVYNIANII